MSLTEKYNIHNFSYYLYSLKHIQVIFLLQDLYVSDWRVIAWIVGNQLDIS